MILGGGKYGLIFRFGRVSVIKLNIDLLVRYIKKSIIDNEERELYVRFVVF